MEHFDTERSRHRLRRARENLHTAQSCYDLGIYDETADHAYLAAYSAISALPSLVSYRLEERTGIFQRFSLDYVKTGLFDKRIPKILKSAYRSCKNANHNDFYQVTADEAEAQITSAEAVLHQIESFLTPIYEKHEKETTT